MELKNQRITSILLICIFVILLLSIIITPTTFYRAQWSYSNIVGSEIIKESTYIEMPSSEEHPYLYIIYGKLINQIEQCPGIPLLLGIISLVTGLEVLEIYNFFPLGEILFVLSSFFIANIFFKGDKKKTTILALFSAIGIFGPSMLRIDFHVLQTSIMAFSFAVTLWATHKDMLNNEFKNISFIIFLLLINRLIYFSSSIFFYVFLVSFSLILFIFSFYEKGKRNNIQLHALIYTALALLMLFTWSELNLFDYLIDQTTVLILAILGITLILLIFLIILSLIKREDLIILTKKINDNLINNLKYIILLGLIFTPVFLIIGTSYFSLIESIFINRIFSIIFIIPSLFILPYILRDYLNKKNTEQNIIYLASLLSLFSMLPFSLYMPYLITRGFVFLQIIFFVGAILFISNYGKIKDNWKNFIFLIIVFFLLISKII